MEDTTPQEHRANIPIATIPTTAELRLRMKVCPWCGKRFKTDRGLIQHQRRSADCKMRKLSKQKYELGLIYVNDTSSIGRVATELMPEREPHHGTGHWTPMWLIQLIRTFAKENYSISTEIVDRAPGWRWSNTPRLVEEVNRARDNEARQKALLVFYQLSRKWRQYERHCFQNRIRVSTSDREEIRASLCKYPALVRTSSS